MTPEKLDTFLRALTEQEKIDKKKWSRASSTVSMEQILKKDSQMILDHFSLFSLGGGRHFRFSPYPAHSHHWVELNYMYSGSCVQKVNGTEIFLRKGQALLLDQDTLHELPVLGEDDILLNIYIAKNHLTSSFFSRFSQNNLVSRFLINTMNESLSHDSFLFFPSENRRRLPLFLAEYFCELYDPSECFQDILSSLLVLILTELMEVCKNQSSAGIGPTSSVLQILKYIEKNYRTATLTSVAAHFNLNPDYLSRLLKKQTGSSFQTLLTRQRMITAQLLLRSSTSPIRQIAAEIGYENVSFFYQKFREAFHLSPGEYRAGFPDCTDFPFSPPDSRHNP